jgi:iron complex transport system permease protein
MKPIPRLEDLPDDASLPRLPLGLRPWLLLALLGLLLLAFALVLASGSVAIPLDQIAAVLLGGEAERASWTNVILKVRLPKALVAGLAGAALAISGLMMQTLFRNPLAASDVLGINSGASLGVALVVLAFGAGGALGSSLLSGLGFLANFGLAFAAILGAGCTLLLILLMSRWVESSLTLLVLGLMIGNLTFALVSLLLFFSIPERIQAYINWGFGSFGSVTWEQMPILAGAVLLGLALAHLLSKTLNALLLGETYARSLGLNVRRARLLIISTTALLTGSVTAFCGPIGFLGIAVPHLARSLANTSDHRLLLPACTLLGASAALLAALLAEAPGSRLVLPLNAIMAVFGAPIVIWIILRQRNLQKAFAS